MRCKHCGYPLVVAGTKGIGGRPAVLHATRGGFPGLYRCQDDAVPYGHDAAEIGQPCEPDCLGAREDGGCTHLVVA